MLGTCPFCHRPRDITWLTCPHCGTAVAIDDHRRPGVELFFTKKSPVVLYLRHGDDLHQDHDETKYSDDKPPSEKGAYLLMRTLMEALVEDINRLCANPYASKRKSSLIWRRLYWEVKGRAHQDGARRDLLKRGLASYEDEEGGWKQIKAETDPQTVTFHDYIAFEDLCARLHLPTEHVRTALLKKLREARPDLWAKLEGETKRGKR